MTLVGLKPSWYLLIYISSIKTSFTNWYFRKDYGILTSLPVTVNNYNVGIIIFKRNSHKCKDKLTRMCRIKRGVNLGTRKGQRSTKPSSAFATSCLCELLRGTEDKTWQRGGFRDTAALYLNLGVSYTTVQYFSSLYHTREFFGIFMLCFTISVLNTWNTGSVISNLRYSFCQYSVQLNSIQTKMLCIFHL